MSHPVTRVLALLELLQARPGLTGPELAARLEVDERTVRRYAVRLAELGVPVEAERGRYGGYRLLPGYRLPPLMFGDDEAAAVVLGLMAGRRTGLAVGEAATESALAKLQRVLPVALRERVLALAETVEVTSGGTGGRAAPRAGMLLPLAEAARRRRRVRLGYRSFGGAAGERDLDPYGLVLHSGRWYVTGHDHRRGEVRTFRVDRVVSVEVGEEEFAVPGEFDPVAQVLAGLSAVPYAHRVEVVLHTEAERARRRIPPSVGELTETEGGVLLRMRADRLDGMAQLLAGLGWPFTVLEPAELRAEVRALAARLLESAERGGGAPPHAAGVPPHAAGVPEVSGEGDGGR
ncbi:transcriptional regulator [Microtetraspora sp. NBRC 13810]|uniref:helix-turn-helix transcriptional regulator n=1 Tax=Microtetraspora sp. NBRC 13810 TaxID=3030990 RepID=UPI0024A407E8|nr:YafY family protein [Microtetraspora sp. NBRC 13810]GLW06514.1 transcriptional regulator [Microtetraspora sp. NBRC 13810]